MSSPSGHHSVISRRRSPDRTGANIRRWLATGICGALLVAAIFPLWDAWLINRAGSLVNRVAIQGEVIPDSSAEEDLMQAMELVESVGSRGPYRAGRQVPIWRTYGVAASHLPSDRAFELLLRSRNAGHLDRIGELWLGEVAAATKHWEEAEKIYSRVDASNLLIFQAETALIDEDHSLALTLFQLAKTSLDAAAERARAEALLLDRVGDQPSRVSTLMEGSADRVASLVRIGRGLTNAGSPREAIPVLEEALEISQTNSPGALTEQSIMMNLSLAMAKALPDPADADVLPTDPHTYFALDEAVHSAIDNLIRIRTLAHRSVQIDSTASAYAYAGRTLLLIGDERLGVSYLTKAIKLDPRFVDSYEILGTWYEERGMVIIARKLYEEGVKVLPGDAWLAGAHAVTAYETMPTETALPFLEDAAKMEGTGVLVFAFLSDCYTDLSRIDEARATLHQGLGLYPGEKSLLERLMSLQLDQQREVSGP